MHRTQLNVSFAAVRARAEIQYASVTPQDIDSDLASLDNKPVELAITETRSSSYNPSLFPPGMSSDEYIAYSVATAGEATRIRVTLIVRLDTAVSKLMGRINNNDKLRIRGTARALGNPNALSIVVDSAEILES